MDEQHTLESAAAPLAPDDALARRRHEAQRLIRTHALLAVGVGLVPSAVVDIVAITAIEVRLIGALARVYDFPVPGKLVVGKVLVSLAGGIGSVYLASKLYMGLASVPVVGHAALASLLAGTSGASVYAVGKLFQAHFESGGTLLSSAPAVLRQHFRARLDEGRTVVPGYLAGAT